jgi:hypothetical protein
MQKLMLSQLLQSQLRSNFGQAIAGNCNVLFAALQASQTASKAATNSKCPAKVGHFFSLYKFTCATYRFNHQPA